MADKPDKSIEAAKKLLHDALEQMTKDAKKRSDLEEKTALGLKRLFEKNAGNAKKLNEVIDSIVDNSSSYRKSLKSITEAMEQAADNANISNKQIDKETQKAVENIKTIIAQSSTLSEEFKKSAEEGLKHVKTYKQLTEVVDEAANTVKRLSQLQNSFGDDEETIIKSLRELGKTTEESQKIIEKVKNRTIQQLEDEVRASNEGILTEEKHNEIVEKVTKSIGALVAKSDELAPILEKEKEAHQAIVKAGAAAAQQLEAVNKKSLAPFKKYIDESSDALKKQAKEIVTVAWGISQLVKGLKQGYTEFVKINSVGLANTFETLNIQATEYGMTFESLMKITEQNRIQMYQETIKNGGSFNDAQKKFISATVDLSNGIVDANGKIIEGTSTTAMYGLDRGREITATHMQNVNRSGIDPLSPRGIKATQQLQRSQILLTSSIGESAEAFTANIDAIRELEENQAALATVNEEQRIAIMKNITAQYEQYRLNGLSAEQIKQRIQTEKDLANPLKGQFIEKIKAKFLGPMIASMQAGLAGVSNPSQVAKDYRATQKFRNEMNDEQRSQLTEDERNKYLQAEERYGKAMLKVKNVNAFSGIGAQINALQQVNPGISQTQNEQAGNLASQTALNRGVMPGKVATPEELAQLQATAVAASINKPMQELQQGIERTLNTLNSTLMQLITGVAALAAVAISHGLAALSLTGSATALSGAAAALTAAAAKLGIGGLDPLKKGAGAAASVLTDLALKGAVLYGGYEAWVKVNEAEEKKKKGEISEKEFNEKGGQAVGVLAGAGAGASIGAGVGTVLIPIPFVGTAVGAVVGGLVGGTAGYFGGGAIGKQFGSDEKKVEDATKENIEKTEKGKLKPQATTRIIPQKEREQTGSAVKSVVQNQSKNGLLMPDSNVASAIDTAADRVGVDRGMMYAMAKQESGFKSNAAAGTSSAKGLYQFTNGTWKEMVAKYGKDYPELSKGVNDPLANSIAGALYMKENSEKLQKGGFHADASNIYASHFLGPEGAKQLLSSDDNKIAANVLPRAASANKGVFYGQNGKPKTVGEVKEFMYNKVGKFQEQYNVALNSKPTGPRMTAATSVIKPTGPTMTAAPVDQTVNYSDASVAMLGGAIPTTQVSNVPVGPTQVAQGKIQPAIVPPTTPPPSPINNIDKMIADNIDKSNTHLASINSGIERLIQLSSGRLGTNMQKLPQTSTQAFNKG